MADNFYTDYLAHHGILGQKWGVRRYQNSDGTYTQAGLKRYNASKEEYDKADQAYKTAKKINKHGATVQEEDGSQSHYGKENVPDSAVKKIKQIRKDAKKQMDKDYKHLKQDKLADQGKELYKNGKTITGNSIATEVLSSIGGFTIAGGAYASGQGNKAAGDALKAIGSVTIAVAAGKYVKDQVDARKLRAYYSHSSNY